jgi:hypothetical protein
VPSARIIGDDPATKVTKLLSTETDEAVVKNDRVCVSQMCEKQCHNTGSESTTMASIKIRTDSFQPKFMVFISIIYAEKQKVRQQKAWTVNKYRPVPTSAVATTLKFNIIHNKLMQKFNDIQTFRMRVGLVAGAKHTRP